MFGICRRSAASAQQPGCPEHSGGASRWFDGADADCRTMGRRAPHPNMFSGRGQLSDPHNGSAGCCILTGQRLSLKAAVQGNSERFHVQWEIKTGAEYHCAPLHWVPRWDWTSQTSVPGGEGLSSPWQIQAKVFPELKHRVYMQCISTAKKKLYLLWRRVMSWYCKNKWNYNN